MATPPSSARSAATPDFRLAAFRRRDAGGNRVTIGRPFGVELEIEDWEGVGGDCAITFAVQPASCAVSPTRRAVAVAAGGVTKMRLQLIVLGMPGTMVMVTATLAGGDTLELALMLRGHRA